MAEQKTKKDNVTQQDSNLQDPIVDKLEDFMDRFSRIDVDEMIKGINDMVATEEKDG